VNLQPFLGGVLAVAVLSETLHPCRSAARPTSRGESARPRTPDSGAAERV